MSSNTVRHLCTRTITTLQHFATLHHTSPNYTSLHLFILTFIFTVVSLKHYAALTTKVWTQHNYKLMSQNN